MKRLLKLAKTLGVTYYAYMMEYRAELLLWALSGSLPFILMGAWNQAASQGSFGMTALEFTRYFLAIYLARQLSVVWVIWDFEREIVEGKLAFKLLQPMDGTVRSDALYYGDYCGVFSAVSGSFLGAFGRELGVVFDRCRICLCIAVSNPVHAGHVCLLDREGEFDSGMLVFGASVLFGGDRTP
jgi:hypothetical protein